MTRWKGDLKDICSCRVKMIDVNLSVSLFPSVWLWDFDLDMGFS